MNVMDEENYKKKVLPILRWGEECLKEEYTSIFEFKQDLKAAATVEEKLQRGWVLWQHSDHTSPIQLKIIALLKYLGNTTFDTHFLVQFWAAEEGRHHLSTSNQPFSLSSLSSGLCRYRKMCMDMEGLGSVGRAYQNKCPESTPDLRLYSTDEFPLRDHAARCGFRGYLALPLFDLTHQNQCCGVLELLYADFVLDEYLLSEFDGGLEMAELRSTHIPLHGENTLQVESEIEELLALAIKAVPRLSLAQVWVPCKQCNNSRCMERASFMHSQSRKYRIDQEMLEYVQACTFHKLQIDFGSLGNDLSDVGISKNPLSHYAEKARLGHGFALCLQSVNNNSNHFYAIEFFLQPKYGEDVCGDSSVHMLFRLMEMKLKSFKFMLGGKLLQEYVLQSNLIPNPIDLECIDLLKPMESDIFSESNFIDYLETADLCCLRPSEISTQGWVFWRVSEKEVDKREPTKEKIQYFMKEIAVTLWAMDGMIQFWAPKMVGDRWCLETWDQPYALGNLDKGLASFRKKCVGHHYFVDDIAKEEELGPPGRAFTNGRPELFDDPFLYTAKEFPLRNYALHCGVVQYFILPIFDEHQQFNKHSCVGVLEFIYITSYELEDIIEDIRGVLEEANLRLSHLHFHPEQEDENVYPYLNQIQNHWIEAITKVKDVSHLFTKIPQCHMANVWIQYEKCTSSKCMRLLFTSGDWSILDGFYAEPKFGITGMVLESEGKSCFCPNIWGFSISEQPVSYLGRKSRCNACFTICLQSSHTGDLLYVFEFFLFRSPATYHYLQSFLSFLLPVLKCELKSFKVASGKQLGEEELVVEIIEFSQSNQLTFPESDKLHEFPIKFKSVVRGKKRHQRIEEQDVQPNPEVGQREENDVVASTSKKTEKGKRKSSRPLSLEREENDVVASTSKKIEKGKRKSSRPLSLEREENDAVASTSKKTEKGKRKSSRPLSLEREENDAVASTSKKTEKGKRKSSRPLSLEREENDAVASTSKKTEKGKRKSSRPLTLEREENDAVASTSKKTEKGKRKSSRPLSLEREENDAVASTSKKTEKGKRKSSRPLSLEREENDAVASTSKKTEKGKRKCSLPLSLKDLKPHFGKKLKDVEDELGVGRSTIKRACREYGIGRWPCNEEQAMKLYLSKTESIQDHQHENPGPSSSSRSSLQVLDTSLQQNTNTQPLLAGDEAEKVMIKVKYGEDTLRIELCLPLGVAKLREEVARRINLNMDGFKLKYMDEDDEEILIACDEDLQLCPKTRASTGNNCIRLFIPK